MFTVWFRFKRCIGPVRSQCRIPFQTAGGKEAITGIGASKSLSCEFTRHDDSTHLRQKKVIDMERSSAYLTRGNDDCNRNIVAKYIAAAMTGDANIPQDDWRQDAAEHQNAKQQISQ